MNTRTFGRTGWQVSAVGFGAWGIGGGQWGGADEAESMAALHTALDLGINFFDTADVYGDGLSERLIARLRRERTEPFYVATKAGRRLNPHVADGYTADNLLSFVDRSLKNGATDCNCIARRQMSTTGRRCLNHSTGSWSLARFDFMA